MVSHGGRQSETPSRLTGWISASSPLRPSCGSLASCRARSPSSDWLSWQAGRKWHFEEINEGSVWPATTHDRGTCATIV